uniref:Uncharacterized protein n=1 Tax=Rhizophora mucronata TaxID=61149 RepID=A0A2P2NIG2_RHIMU
MDPNNYKFDDLDAMLLSLFDDDGNDDKYSLSSSLISFLVSSITLSDPSLLEEEDSKETCSSSFPIKKPRRKMLRERIEMWVLLHLYWGREAM